MAQQAEYAISIIVSKHPVLTLRKINDEASTQSLGDFVIVPAEIRNHIHRLALTAPSAIQLKRHEDRPAGSSTPVNTMKLCGTILATKGKGKQKRRIACAKGTGIALLRSSKIIHQEASPIFYSVNKFLFTHPWDTVQSPGWD